MQKESIHTRAVQRSVEQPFYKKKRTSDSSSTQTFIPQTWASQNAKADPYEREADRVADQVVQQKNEPGTVLGLHKQITPLVQQKSSELEGNQIQAVPEEEYSGGVEDKVVQAPTEKIQEKGLISKPERPPQTKREQSLQIQTEEGQRKSREEPQNKNEKELSTQIHFKPPGEIQTNLATPGNYHPSYLRHVSRMESISGLLRLSKAGGRQIPRHIQTRLNKIFGVDFSNVRIHTDVLAERMNKMLNAQAFVLGRDIYFNAGKFDPNTKKGVHLLAHELTHTIQQGAVSRNPLASETPEKSFEVNPTSLEQVSSYTEGPGPSNPSKEEIPVENKAIQTEEGKTVEADKKEGEEKEKKEVEKKAPTTPEEDPAFQETKTQIKKTRKKKQRHKPAGTKVQQVDDAAHLDESSQQGKNERKAHMAEIDQAASPKRDLNKPFTPETFKNLLKSHLDKLETELPDSESDVKRFKKDKPLEKIKKDINNQVVEENKKIVKPLPEQVNKEKPSGPVETAIAPKALVKDKTGARPKPINNIDAAPKPKYDEEISMEKESQGLDDLMEENEMTDSQLEKSKEPKFIRASETKKKAQEEAKAVPDRYRKEEKQILKTAQQKAKEEGEKGFGKMQSTRKGQFEGVHKEQGVKEQTVKTEKQKIYEQFQGIYDKSKKGVDDILDWVATEVDRIFREEVDAAMQVFERNVEKKLDDIIGWWDWLTGRDWDAINGVFRDEKNRFVNTMNRVLDRIANLISTWLNHAIGWINWGKSETQRVFNSLDKSKQKLAKEALDIFNSQYDVLRDSVFEQEKEMAEMLAESYKENVDSLKKTFDKIRVEVSKTWLERAIDFIKDVAKAIYRLGKLLKRILSKVIHLIGDILDDPIGFFENLAKGIKQGFEKFKKDIDGYLLTAFFDWLRGKVSGPGIKLPKKFDASGLFDLTTQLLGINYASFKEIAQRVFGRKMVAFFEKGVGKAKKGFGYAKKVFELFQIIKSEGLGGLWQHIKQIIANRISEIFEKVKKKVLYETIKKALVWIAGLFNPVGAFIKIVMLVYKAMKWLVDNIDRIETLVNAMIDSVELAIKGNVGAIVGKVITAIRTFIVMAIDFLAKILGLGDLAKKVRRIINMLRKPIRKGIEWFLRKMKPTVMKVARAIRKAAKKGKKMYQKGKAKVKAGAQKLKEKITGKSKKGVEASNKEKTTEAFEVTKDLSMSGEGHTLYAKWNGMKFTFLMASNYHQRIFNLASDAVQEVEKSNLGNSEKSRAKQTLEMIKVLSDSKEAEEDYIASGARIGDSDEKLKRESFIAKRLGMARELIKQLADAYKIKSLEDFLKETPEERYLPAGYNVRSKLYERGNGYDSVLSSYWGKLSSDRFKEIQHAHKMATDPQDPRSTLWDKLKAKNIISSTEHRDFSYPKVLSRTNYPVDHEPPLAKHWVKSGGNNSSDLARDNAAILEEHLSVVTQQANLEKQAGGYHFVDKLFVGKNFSSAKANSPLGSDSIDGEKFRASP